MSLRLALELIAYVPTVICVPLAVYQNMKLYTFHDQIFLQKRSISLVFGLNTVLIINMLSTCFCGLALSHFHHHLFIIAVVSWQLSWWFLLFSITVKNWMVHFKYKWTYYTLQLKWQRIINPQIVSEMNKKNWYIHNNKTYGNLYYIYKLFGTIYCIMLICCVMSIYFISNPNSSTPIKILSAIVQVITAFPSIIFYFFITFKTPAFDDVFYMHWESRAHAKILMIIGLCCVMINCVLVLVGTHDKVLNLLMAGPSLTLCFYAMNYVSTVMIYKKNKQHLQLKRSLSKTRDIEIKLRTILTNKKAINLFMDHLSKEYNMECLLAFIEFNQFQRYLMSMKQKHQQTKNEDVDIVDFPENIPTSAIVETDFKISMEKDGMDNNDMKTDMYNAKIKAYKLYNKYVKSSAELEINISATQRDDIANSIADLDVLLSLNMSAHDLIIAFQDIKKELFTLLCFALYRFKLSSDFDQIASILSKNGDMNSKLKNIVLVPTQSI